MNTRAAFFRSAAAEPVSSVIDSHAPLFAPISLGAISLSHRVIMAPLTRLRAGAGNVPVSMNAAYYAQRATPGGLIITEATQVAVEGQGYPASPGIHTEDQAAGWRAVVDAVHARGGIILLQLWHVGRISHSSFQPGGAPPVAPSSVRPAGEAFTADWRQAPFETPRALREDELPSLVEAYRRGARLARRAGFDGVEVHAANGYLLDQFLRDRSNRRTDRYGGSIENRSRFPLEAIDAVIGVWGADRVGVRLSPFGAFNDMGDSDPVALFGHVLRELDRRRIAYAHLIEPRQDEMYGFNLKETSTPVARTFRHAFSGPIIAAGGYDGAGAARAVAAGDADAVAFGRSFIANPDLPERLRRGAPLNAHDRATFYGGGEKGYLDYPALNVAT